MSDYAPVAGGDIIYAATINDILKYSPNKRFCQLRQVTTGQTYTHGTGAVLLFGSGTEDFDDYGWHSTSSNTSRVIPDIPGVYKVTCKVTWAASTTITSASCNVLKNGTTFESSGSHKPNATNTLATFGGIASGYVQLNGTTDYVEGWTIQFSSGSASQTTNVVTSGYTTLLVELEHYA